MIVRYAFRERVVHWLAAISYSVAPGAGVQQTVVALAVRRMRRSFTAPARVPGVLARV